jgi:uncharacterized protein YndB with AHSA1/START domain
MIEIQTSATYQQPPEVLFAVLADLGGYPAWQADVLSAEANGAAAVGTEVHQVRKIMGRHTDVGLTVTEYDPGKLIVLATAEGASPGVEQTYRALTDGTGSRLEFRLRLEGVPRMAEHLAKAQLGKQVPKLLAALGDQLTQS